MSFENADEHALYCLIYHSRAVVNSADEMPEMVQSILSTAVPRNNRLGISGALLACDRWFVQALEGDRLAIWQTYERICRDPRHARAQIVRSGPIDARNFAGWGMCGRTLSERDDAIIATLKTRKAFDPNSLSWQAALKLLKVVRNLQTGAPPASASPVSYL